MVVYDLICKKKHSFEGWFPSFEGYQEQAAQGRISCPVCGTIKVEKVPHACALLSSRGEKEEKKQKEPRARKKKATTVELTEAQAKELSIRLNHYVRENFEDVGPNFAKEAKEIHYERSEKRSIYGTSTPEEREELDEEGIPYSILPKPELDS